MPEKSTFPLSKFPDEIRHRIWEMAIREANWRRIVLINENNQIHVTKKLICPLFSVNSESRAVALKLYPMALPIFCIDDFNASYWSLDEDQDSVDSDLASIEGDLGPLEGVERRCTQGLLHVSPEHDIFFYECLDVQIGLKNAYQNYVTCPLSADQCGQVKHIMEVTERSSDWYGRMIGTGAWECLKNVNHTHKKAMFPNLRSCHHIIVDISDDLESTYLSSAWDLTGRDIFRLLGKHIMLYYGKDMGKKRIVNQKE